MAALGAAGCGGGGEEGGAGAITFTFIPDQAGGLKKLIDKFNRQNKGEIRVEWREMPAASADYFEQIQAELQSGQSNVDIVGGTSSGRRSSPPTAGSSTSPTGSPTT